ncbi:MAG: histidinol-phosphatase [Pseudomonadota bacterium]
MTDEELDVLTDLAHRMADHAGAAALKHFRADRLSTDNKAGEAGFDPVTAGDREAEAAMRALLTEERPTDGIFGEEHGVFEGTSGLTWVLDPIDGTRAFISGLPTWGVLIALDDGVEGRIGVIDQPFTGERFTGVRGHGARFARNGATHQIATRACDSLSEATLLTTDISLFTKMEAVAFEDIRQRTRLTRYGMDCYAYAMVAMGHVDLVIESGLAAYDIAAPAALVEAAGGVATDWQGRDVRWGGRSLVAGDPRVHAEALEILSKIPDQEA